MSFGAFVCVTSLGMAILFGAVYAAHSKAKGETWRESRGGFGCLVVSIALFSALYLTVLNTCTTVYEEISDHDDYHYGIWQGEEGRRREAEARHRREQRERERREQRERERAESEAEDAAGMIFDRQ